MEPFLLSWSNSKGQGRESSDRPLEGAVGTATSYDTNGSLQHLKRSMATIKPPLHLIQEYLFRQLAKRCLAHALLNPTSLSLVKSAARLSERGPHHESASLHYLRIRPQRLASPNRVMPHQLSRREIGKWFFKTHMFNKLFLLKKEVMSLSLSLSL